MRFNLLCILIFLQLHSTAQQVYQSYSPANGLVDARVTNMVQDKYGRLILLTREGFSIFDGQRFTNYLTVDGVQVGITDQYIFLPDSSLYILLFNGGAAKIERNRVSYDSNFLKGIVEISSVVKAAANDYLVVSNYGIYRYKNGVVTKIIHKTPGYPPFARNIIHAAPYKDLVVLSYTDFGKNFQLLLFDLNKEQILTAVHTEFFYKLIRDGAGNIFVQNKMGISQVDNASLEKRELKFTSPWFSGSLPSGFKPANLFADGASNVLLIGKDKSAVMVQYSAGKTTFFSKREAGYKEINNFFTDAENNHWTISSGNGIQKLVQANYEKLNIPDASSIDNVYNSYNVAGRGVFAGTSNGYYFIKEEGIKKILPGINGIITQTFFWNGLLWTYEDKNSVRNSNGKTIKFVFTDSSTADLQISSKFSIDKKGNLVIAGNYLNLFTAEGEALAAQLPYFADKITCDEENNYWVFCRAGFLLKYAYSDNKLHQLFQKRIPLTNIRSAEHWNKDTFLLGTRTGGLLLVKANEHSFSIIQSISRSNGLSNNFVLNVLKLDANNFAAGTASGLDIISFYNGDTSIQKISLGINNYEPVYNLFKDDAGKLYGITESSNSIFLYNAGKFDSLSYRPDAYIHSVQVNGRKIALSEVNFNYRQNNFLFEAATPSFIDNNNINFYFSLNGVNDNRPFINTTGTWAVNNLEPGTYHLKIRIVYPGKIYPEQVLQYDFTINKPFWKAWWFYMLLVILVSGIIFLVTYSYFRQQLVKRQTAMEKKQAVEKERTRIATDMHDDFGASLSRIKFLSEKIQLQSGKDGKINEDLGKISAYSDEMAEKMGEIVWALNQRYDTSGDLISFCRSYASEFFEGKNIKLQFKSEGMEDLKINGEIRRNIFLVMKEALQNIVKHAAATEVAINMTCLNELKLVIRDNGHGFDKGQVRPFANGLVNMKKRIEEINGSILIENNGGTCITILV